MSAQVYESGRRLALGASVTSAHWIGEEAWFALGDGGVLVAPRDGETRRTDAHDGAILCAAPHPDGKRLVTGGDDGRVNVISRDGVELLGALRAHVETGRLSEATLHAELGEIVAGRKTGREREDETILFWHRGLSLSDIALGSAMLDKAARLGIGHRLRYA